ncbi:hypothetical protein ECC02_000853 [Trypanosoma cruzi]|uniref:Uncharacterized protein n=1 Tax=Trypanosoma cruzi TaxID=5693 RepID=A0A7J6YGP0_TRYCR|nr:hypothetical protein ECC02_000853 [Trypanosoma cruzi]
MQPAAAPTGMPASATSCRMPAKSVSSLYVQAKWIGFARFILRSSGARDMHTAMNPFMSHVPRPYSFPSRSVSVNGSLFHFCPSTGTTSVWPERMMPPSVTPPSPGRVAHRFAWTSSAALCTTTFSRPHSSTRYARMHAISSRFEFRLVVSKAMSRRSHSTESNGICYRLFSRLLPLEKNKIIIIIIIIINNVKAILSTMTLLPPPLHPSC